MGTTAKDKRGYCELMVRDDSFGGVLGKISMPRSWGIICGSPFYTTCRTSCVNTGHFLSNVCIASGALHGAGGSSGGHRLADFSTALRDMIQDQKDIVTHDNSIVQY